MRSPAVISMSSSRGGGIGLTSRARSRSSSVVSPIADTATTTSLPALRVSMIRRATRLMLSASATDEPPYFCTTIGTTDSSRSVRGRGASTLRRRRGIRPHFPYAGPRPSGRRPRTARGDAAYGRILRMPDARARDGAPGRPRRWPVRGAMRRTRPRRRCPRRRRAGRAPAGSAARAGPWPPVRPSRRDS